MITVQKRFDQSAKTYSNSAFIQNQVFQRLCEDIQPGATSLLDLGCADGYSTQKLAEKLDISDVIGVDFSKELIHKAQSTYPQFTWQKSSIEDLQLSRTFDVIVSNASLQWMSDFKQALNTIKRHKHDTTQIRLSMFGPDTYTELASVCGPLPAQSFIGAEAIQQAVEDSGLNLQVTQTKFTKCFPDLKSLFLEIKRTGTQGTSHKGVWTPRMFQKLEDEYLKQFGRIWVSYQVFFLKGESS